MPPFKLSTSKVEKPKAESNVDLILNYLMIPTLVLLMVAIGRRFPPSLVGSLVILMWSTKPIPTSIYAWVEKVPTKLLPSY